jgi:hypothetical protein
VVLFFVFNLSKLPHDPTVSVSVSFGPVLSVSLLNLLSPFDLRSFLIPLPGYPIPYRVFVAESIDSNKQTIFEFTRQFFLFLPCSLLVNLLVKLNLERKSDFESSNSSTPNYFLQYSPLSSVLYYTVPVTVPQACRSYFCDPGPLLCISPFGCFLQLVYNIIYKIDHFQHAPILCRACLFGVTRVSVLYCTTNHAANLKVLFLRPRATTLHRPSQYISVLSYIED